MSQVRSALDLIARSNVALWDEESPLESPVVIDQRGALFVRIDDRFVDLDGNVALPHEQRFGLLNPFEFGGLSGPDLRKPRPDLRIVPSRVAGEPHVAHTRITTRTILALSNRGLSVERVAAMYGLEPHVVEQALDLESALAVA
jgi:uncharacterized protein (DUF433 family)